MQGQYENLLRTYQSQGQRAYIIAFTEIFLYDLFWSDSIAILLVGTFIASFLLLKTWIDGLLTGLLTGVIVALLALYIIKNYFPDTLVAGWLPVVLEKLWLGVVNGLAIGVVGAFGGFLRQKMITKRLAVELVDSAAKRFYKCPKCGTEYGSNPEFCSNCGHRVRRIKHK
jgi:uncharacterized membrane protein YeaQ/YmgE (transglycosylase-associated protein family)